MYELQRANAIIETLAEMLEWMQNTDLPAYMLRHKARAALALIAESTAPATVRTTAPQVDPTKKDLL